MSFRDRDTFGTSKERKLSVVLIFCTTGHINVMCKHVAHKTWNFFPKKYTFWSYFWMVNFRVFDHIFRYECHIWGHFLVKKFFVVFRPSLLISWIKMLKTKPEKRETFFVAIFSKFKIGNKFRPPKSSMGTLFLPRSSKNGTFFAFEAAISAREVL